MKNGGRCAPFCTSNAKIAVALLMRVLPPALVTSCVDNASRRPTVESTDATDSSTSIDYDHTPDISMAGVPTDAAQLNTDSGIADVGVTTDARIDNACSDPREPDNSTALAQPISIDSGPSQLSARLCPNDVDYYSLDTQHYTLGQSIEIFVDVASDGAYLTIRVFTDDGRTILSTDLADSAPILRIPEPNASPCPAALPRRYYVAIAAPSEVPATGIDYALDVSSGEIDWRCSPDSGEMEVGNNRPDLITPILVPEGQDVKFDGTLCPTDVDWYELEVGAPSLTLSYDTTGDPLRVDVWNAANFNPNASPLPQPDATFLSVGGVPQDVIDCMFDGVESRWFVRVRASACASGSSAYAFTASARTATCQ